MSNKIVEKQNRAVQNLVGITTGLGTVGAILGGAYLLERCKIAPTNLAISGVMTLVVTGKVAMLTGMCATLGAGLGAGLVGKNLMDRIFSPGNPTEAPVAPKAKRPMKKETRKAKQPKTQQKPPEPATREVAPSKAKVFNEKNAKRAQKSKEKVSNEEAPGVKASETKNGEKIIAKTLEVGNNFKHPLHNKTTLVNVPKAKEGKNALVERLCKLNPTSAPMIRTVYKYKGLVAGAAVAAAMATIMYQVYQHRDTILHPQSLFLPKRSKTKESKNLPLYKMRTWRDSEGKMRNSKNWIMNIKETKWEKGSEVTGQDLLLKKKSKVKLTKEESSKLNVYLTKNKSKKQKKTAERKSSSDNQKVETSAPRFKGSLKSRRLRKRAQVFRQRSALDLIGMGQVEMFRQFLGPFDIEVRQRKA